LMIVVEILNISTVWFGCWMLCLLLVFDINHFSGFI
jgi:hypothetical protein